MSGEVLFPPLGREQVDGKSRMGVNALEYVEQVDRGIDALQVTRGDEALHDANVAGADCGPTSSWPRPSVPGNWQPLTC